MTRPPITLTAAEWASVQPDGTMWLAWEAGWPKACPLPDPTDCNGEHCDCPLGPPVEFVQACAPCDHHQHHGDRAYCPACGPGGCPACRIELELTEGFAFPVVVGHAYAIGQPLPISDVWPDQPPADGLLFVPTGRAAYHKASRPTFWLPGQSKGTEFSLAALANYGPPETLVDRWALQLRVVG